MSARGGRSQPGALLLLLLGAALPAAVRGQYLPGTVLYNQTWRAGLDALQSRLQNAPVLEDIYYPAKYMLSKDFYTFTPPDRDVEYTQNVIFDPCRGYDYACCSDTFGTPEFLAANSSTTAALQRDDGSPMDITISRRPDNELYLDVKCMGLMAPAGRSDCVMAGVAQRPFPIVPRCWNWNETIIADAGCRSPADGTPLPLCMEVGFTQTAYIVECGGAFMDNEHCGTYLEVHLPGLAEKLSETKLRGTYTSGYRMSVITTTYREDVSRTLCWDPIRLGRHEMWWVQRTLYSFQVERRIPFRIISPECDWDGGNNRYLPYATLFEADGVTRKARQLAGQNPYDPAALLFTRVRTEGTPGYPGLGMGSTLVPITPSSYPSTAVFGSPTGNEPYKYSYSPDLAHFTIERGVIEPSFAEQAVIAELLAIRGYRQLKEAGKTEEARVVLAEAVREARALFE